MSDFRILTLWQPWASLIEMGLKRYETRCWNTNYRGKLLIHAAKRPIRPDECQLIQSRAEENKDVLWDALCKITARTNYGCIVAIANLANCKMMNLAEEGEIKDSFFEWIDETSELERAVGDWSLGRYAWKLENVIALPEPIPHKGGQGLRKLHDEAIAHQLHQLIL